MLPPTSIFSTENSVEDKTFIILGLFTYVISLVRPLLFSTGTGMKIGLKTPLCLSGHQIDRLLLENWFHREQTVKKDLRICSSLWRNMLPSASWCGRDPITIGGLWAPNCHQQSRSNQGYPTYPSHKPPEMLPGMGLEMH